MMCSFSNVGLKIQLMRFKTRLRIFGSGAELNLEDNITRQVIPTFLQGLGRSISDDSNGSLINYCAKYRTIDKTMTIM